MQRTRGERTYGQYCPVAAGLDLIGDRWVLLICRELVHRPRGFNEIKHALPGLASNLLSTRLRTMTADGLVAREGTGYRLTEQGRAVIPVLRAVARFGVGALATEPAEPIDALRLARGFLLPWLSTRQFPISTRQLPAVVVVHAPDGTAVDLLTGQDGVQLRERAPGEAAPGPDAVVLHVDAQNIAAVRRDGAEFTGSAEGPEPARSRVLKALALTPPTE